MKQKLRLWLLAIVREAIRAELGDRLSVMEARQVATPVRREAEAPKQLPRVVWSQLKTKLEGGMLESKG